jgi:hypothetical protein
MMQKPPRPTGITILAILGFIGGILALLGGALFLAVASSGILSSYGMGMFSGFVSVFGGVIIVVGLFAIFVSWGMWSGKSWAWYLAVILYAIGVVFGLVILIAGALTGIVSLLIEVLLLWYMFRPHVKAFFGIGGGMMQQAPMMQSQPTTTT